MSFSRNFLPLGGLRVELDEVIALLDLGTCGARGEQVATTMTTKNFMVSSRSVLGAERQRARRIGVDGTTSTAGAGIVPRPREALIVGRRAQDEVRAG